MIILILYIFETKSPRWEGAILTTGSPSSSSVFPTQPQDPQLPEAHVEGRALVGAIQLSHNHHVDAAGQRGLVDALVELLHCDDHLPRQLPHIIHGLRLKETEQIG